MKKLGMITAVSALGVFAVLDLIRSFVVDDPIGYSARNRVGCFTLRESRFSEAWWWAGFTICQLVPGGRRRSSAWELSRAARQPPLAISCFCSSRWLRQFSSMVFLSGAHSRCFCPSCLYCSLWRPVVGLLAGEFGEREPRHERVQPGGCTGRRSSSSVWIRGSLARRSEPCRSALAAP